MRQPVEATMPARRTRVAVIATIEHPALVEAGRPSGLGTKLHFAEFQSDTSTWYPAMDAFVLPSHAEGTPMALRPVLRSDLSTAAATTVRTSCGITSWVSRTQALYADAVGARRTSA